MKTSCPFISYFKIAKLNKIFYSFVIKVNNIRNKGMADYFG